MSLNHLRADLVRSSTTRIANRVKSSLASLAIGVPLVLGLSAAFPWGSYGHQIIAGLAIAQLTPRAKVEVDRLLALEPDETLSSISTWADEHKNPSTARWHYVNCPRDSCTFDAARDGVDGQCLPAAIERQSAVFTSSAPDEKQLNAEVFDSLGW